METLYLVWDTYLDKVTDYKVWRESNPHKARMHDWVEDLRAPDGD